MGRSALLAKKEAAKVEDDGEQGEGEGEELDDEDVQLSVLKKRAAANPTKPPTAVPGKSLTSSISNSAITASPPKPAGKGFKVPVSQVERKKHLKFKFFF
jgi:hypothetical protein